MSHIQYKYQTRYDFKLLYSNIKHKWKCSNIMKNKNDIHFSVYTVSPLLSGRYKRQTILFFLHKQVRHQNKARL